MAKAAKANATAEGSEYTIATAAYSLRSGRMLPYPKPAGTAGLVKARGGPNKEAQEQAGVSTIAEPPVPEISGVEPKESHFVVRITEEMHHKQVNRIQKLRERTVLLWERGDRYKLKLQRALEASTEWGRRMKTAVENAEHAAERAEEAEQDALAEKYEMEEELKMAEERAEFAEEAERGARTDMEQMEEELWAAEERADHAEGNLQAAKAQQALLESQLAEAIEQMRRAEGAEQIFKGRFADVKELWKKAAEQTNRAEEAERASRARMVEMKEALRTAEEGVKSAKEAEEAVRVEVKELEEDLRKAEARAEEAENTDLAKRTKSAEENAARAHSEMMRYWRALTMERRQVQLLQEELANGEPPAGFAQGPEFCDPLPEMPF